MNLMYVQVRGCPTDSSAASAREIESIVTETLSMSAPTRRLLPAERQWPLPALACSFSMDHASHGATGAR